MKWAYNLGGGTPMLKRYFIGSSFSNAGIPAIQAGAGDYGIIPCANTGSVASFVGVTLDTATASTTQGDTTHMREGLAGVVTVAINPDAAYRIRLSGGATEGTSLAITTNSVAETAGTVVTITTGDPAPNSPEMDEGTAIGVAGANVGYFRKIDATAATTATVELPFPNDIASGDVFLIVPATAFPDAKTTVQLTTNFYEADASAAWSGDADLRTVELEIDFSSQANARANTYLIGVFGDSIFTN